MPGWIRRATAALVAVICWAGLAVQFSATYGATHDLAATLWILLRFFTVITNLLVAVTMTGIAAGRRVSAFWLGGVTLAIIFVGVIYMALLRGLMELSHGALLADALLHKVSPLATAIYWVLFAPRGPLSWRAPLWWALYPIAYFAYALVRGATEGRYPYPFVDVGRIGASQTALNAVLIAAVFVVAGLAIVWLDRHLGRTGRISKAFM